MLPEVLAVLFRFGKELQIRLFCFFFSITHNQIKVKIFAYGKLWVVNCYSSEAFSEVHWNMIEFIILNI